jgi:hypothetical protein
MGSQNIWMRSCSLQNMARLAGAMCLLVLAGCGGSAPPSATPTLMILPSALPGVTVTTAPAPIPGAIGGTSVYGVIAAHPDLTRMAQYFDLSGLTATLEGRGRTVFAIPMRRSHAA